MSERENPALPLLSIAIPTRQRRAFLEETLGSVVPEAERLGCEVVVSDNASDDGTAAFLADLALAHPVVRVHRQATNVGLDANMRDVVARCRGGHVWQLGDDDVATPGAVGRILEVLRLRGPDLLILQAWIAGPRLEPIARLVPGHLEGASFQDPVEAFSAAWRRMPFGSFVAAREHLAAGHWSTFLGTSHAYTGAVWTSLATLARPASVLFGSVPDVILRGAEKSWRRDEALVYLQQIPRWFDLLPSRLSGPVATARRSHQDQISKFKFLLGLRAQGQLTPSLASATRLSFPPLRRSRALAIARLPVPLARALESLRELLRFPRRPSRPR